MYLLMQDRATDLWMYYMGKGMWCGDKPSAHIFSTEKDAQSIIDLLKKEADWAIEHMSYIPCGGPFKIVPYE